MNQMVRNSRMGISFNVMTEDSIPVIKTLETPSTVRVPLRQYHLNLPLQFSVSKGNHVEKGAVLVHALSEKGVPVHAPVSGVVRGMNAVRLADRDRPESVAVEIKAAVGEQNCHKSAFPESPVARIKSAGIVGLGGACYPSHLKMKRLGHDGTLVINLMESDPEILNDRALVKTLGAERTLDLVTAVSNQLGVRSTIVCYPIGQFFAEALGKSIGRTGVTAIPMPNLYALGNSRILLNHLCRNGTLEPGLRAPVFNLGTIRAIHDALSGGNPLVSRLVTVTFVGSEMQTVYEVPLGTSLDVLCQNHAADTPPLVRSGGFALPCDLNPEDVVGPMTGSVVFEPEKATKPHVLPCIGCNLCDAHCPVNISPRRILSALGNGLERAVREGFLECIGCQSCDYSCPSTIPIARLLVDGQEQYREQVRQEEKRQAAQNRYGQTMRKRTALDDRNTSFDNAQEESLVKGLVSGAISRQKRGFPNPREI